MSCQDLEPVIEFYERMAQDYDKQYDTLIGNCIMRSLGIT